RLHGAAVPEGDADAGVGADQAFLAHRDDDIAAPGEGTHGGTAAAEVGAAAHEHAGGDAALHHVGAVGAGVKVDEALVHDGGAFPQVGAEAHPGGVGDEIGRAHV